MNLEEKTYCLYPTTTTHYIKLEAKNAGIHLISWKTIENDETLLEDVSYVITNGYVPDNWQLDKLPNLRLISNLGVGLDHLDIPNLSKKNILVSNTPGVMAPPVAETAFGLMIAVARKFKQSQKIFELGYFKASVTLSSEVSRSSLGIIGLGDIGCEIAKRAKAFDMKILYHQRNQNKKKEDLYDATYYQSLDDMLPLCDFIVLCCPYNGKTHHMINQKQLDAMKSGSFLINVGRGALVNTEALVNALNSGHLAGAGLDVTDPEPLPVDHPLLQMPNVFVTPHIGSETERTLDTMSKMTISNIVDVMNGKHCPHVVNYPST